MRTLPHSFVCWVFIAALAFVGVRPAESAQLYVTDEEYKVYSAIIRAKHQTRKTRTVVIIKTASGDLGVVPGLDDRKTLLTNLSPLTIETLNDYEYATQSPRELSNKFELRTRTALVEEQKLDEIFDVQSRKGWDFFNREFPGSDGFIQFSRVGFDAARTQAVLYVSHGCSGRCASGRCSSGIYYLLEKHGNRWRIRNEYAVMVS